jgi:poly-gamma-glutamate capsule biosynthesis protein CapA/YwtB (metallophosphatase superfamily)
MRYVRSAVIVSVVAGAALLVSRQPAAQEAGAANRRDGQIGSRELATTVRDGFTMAATGDLIVAYPQSQNPEPSFQGMLKLIRDADVATGNYEGNIIDGRKFKGAGPGGFAGVPEVAADLKAMGWDLVARSNNHIGEYGPEGLRETNDHLDKAGVVYAGSGDTYWAARSARFVSTPRGRVGMVATASSYAAAVMAEPGRGEWPGRGGQSALRTTRTFVVPPALFQSVTAIRGAFPNGTGFYAPPYTATEATILGERFRVDPNAKEPYYSFEMNKRDLDDIVAAVREGKMRSDFMTVAIHAHHFRDAKGGERGVNVPETEGLDTNPSVADYLVTFAKATIDAGADVFQGTGVHTLRGIEIYKGKPIFYGLGEFFRQMDTVGLSGLGPRGRGEANSPPVKYESVVAIVRWDKGQLAEVRLTPIQITDDVRMAHRGIPHLAPPEVGQRILTRLQRLSAPFGTKIAIEQGVGVIRPAPAAPTTQQGQQ